MFGSAVQRGIRLKICSVTGDHCGMHSRAYSIIYHKRDVVQKSGGLSMQGCMLQEIVKIACHLLSVHCYPSLVPRRITRLLLPPLT